MKVLIIGGAGMIGEKLHSALAKSHSGKNPVTEVILHDRVEPRTAFIEDHGFQTRVLTGNFADQAEVRKLASLRPDVIFHLAAIVSGEAENDFQKGWDINGHGTWQLLEALRAEHVESGGTYVPRLVFTSSIAVFGPPYPEQIPDDFLCTPQTSYGAQKVVGELLVADYSRKGYLDGFSIRLPTICVRPGKPNLAASSFFSGIIREPLNGMDAVLPVPDTVRHWLASPRAAAGFLVHAMTLDTSLLENRLSLNLPGVSCTVAEQIEALRKLAGDDIVKHIKPGFDENIMRIVEGWPRDFSAERAKRLGFTAEEGFEEIIRTYMEDDLDIRT
ncbi:MAG: SDR family oxidoreductase [Rhizobiaceae bacterium]|nr:SDR family oxidoreductase [Rhizobiaceae bacterium]